MQNTTTYGEELEQFGIPNNLIALAKMTLSSLSSRVRVRNKLSQAFTIDPVPARRKTCSAAMQHRARKEEAPT